MVIDISRGNQANSARPPKFAQYHFYRKGQQGAVSFVYNLKDFTSNSILSLIFQIFLISAKEDCSLLSFSVEIELSELGRITWFTMVVGLSFSRNLLAIDSKIIDIISGLVCMQCPFYNTHINLLMINTVDKFMDIFDGHRCEEQKS